MAAEALLLAPAPAAAQKGRCDEEAAAGPEADDPRLGRGGRYVDPDVAQQFAWTFFQGSGGSSPSSPRGCVQIM